MFGPVQQFPGPQASYFDSTYERINSINITAVKIMIPTLQTDVKIEQAAYPRWEHIDENQCLENLI